MKKSTLFPLKKLTFLFALICAITGCDSDKSKNISREPSSEEACMDKVRKQLKDPFSAQFEGVTAPASFPSCTGRVNAKNSMGGYTGFKKFIVYTDGSVHFQDE